MPDNVSIERRQMLEVFGAEIIVTPGAEGSNGAVKRAEAMAKQHPEWCFCINMKTNRTRLRIMKLLVQKFGVIAPR